MCLQSGAIYICIPKRGGMLPCDNTLAQDILGWVSQNYKDMMVWERISLDGNLLLSKSAAIFAISQWTNICLLPVKCYSLEELKQHEVPTSQGLKTWLEKKNNNRAIINNSTWHYCGTLGQVLAWESVDLSSATNSAISECYYLWPSHHLAGAMVTGSHKTHFLRTRHLTSLDLKIF